MSEQKTREQAAAARAQAAQQGRSVDPAPSPQGQIVRDQDEE